MKRQGAFPGFLCVLALCELGCGCVWGRSYDSADWRQLVRLETKPPAAIVDDDGFYDSSVCNELCSPESGTTVERCYPVDVVVPAQSTRVVTCNRPRSGAERLRVPGGKAARAFIDEKGQVSRQSCLALCGWDEELDSCTLDAAPPTVEARDQFVVCAYHTPAGCDPVIR